MNQNQQPSPTQDAMRWIGAALTDHKDSLLARGEKAAAEAFFLRAQSALNQLDLALAPQATPLPSGDVTPPPRGPGRPRKNGATQPVPTQPVATEQAADQAASPQ